MTDRDALIHLRDGRTLAYAEYGHPDGAPILYFHGWPGSRLEGALTQDAARRLGARILSLDRPGMGLSDFKPGRAILDWPRDVAEFADKLGLGRFSVVGISGGCPYALATASALKDRVAAIGIVCGLAPTDSPGVASGMVGWYRVGLWAARHSPWPVRLLLAGMTRAILKNPHRTAARKIKSHSLPDQEVLADPHFRRMLRQCAVESFQNGLHGPAWDGTLLGRPWGFPLEEISNPVFLWHGEMDETVPPAMGRSLAGALPNCRACFVPSEGHLSLPLRRMDEILAALLT